MVLNIIRIIINVITMILILNIIRIIITVITMILSISIMAGLADCPSPDPEEAAIGTRSTR